MASAGKMAALNGVVSTVARRLLNSARTSVRRFALARLR
jgi:hypothetical protein